MAIKSHYQFFYLSLQVEQERLTSASDHLAMTSRLAAKVIVQENSGILLVSVGLRIELVRLSVTPIASDEF